MNKEKLLILNSHPFGTLTDCYKWCQYLCRDYDVSLICLDDGKRLEMEKVNIFRVGLKNNKLVRGIKYVVTCLWHILFFKGTIFVVYFDHCEILKRLVPWKKMHVDVRTIAVWGDQTLRDDYDARIRKACLCFDSVSVISEGVKKRLELKDAWILPLGADVISNVSKEYNPMRLLYVGTFSNRHIEDTIQGLGLFIKQNPQVDIHYDLIGDGFHGEVENCMSLVEQLNLSERITFHGRIDNYLLETYFDKANIGISYVPITNFFNVQPPTKTYEYILSGLFCVATATDENKKVISDNNGVLIQDNAADFCEGLNYVYRNADNIDEKLVRNSLVDYTWDKIVYQILVPKLFRE